MFITEIENKDQVGGNRKFSFAYFFQNFSVYVCKHTLEIE
jgi:hypothetical protein